MDGTASTVGSLESLTIIFTVRDRTAILKSFSLEPSLPSTIPENSVNTINYVRVVIAFITEDFDSSACDIINGSCIMLPNLTQAQDFTSSGLIVEKSCVLKTRHRPFEIRGANQQYDMEARAVS